MPIWIWVLIIWTALGLLAIAISPIFDVFVRFEAKSGAAKGIIGVFWLPAFLIVVIVRIVWKLLASFVNLIFGGMIFTSLRKTRIRYQIGYFSTTRTQNDAWGIQKHISRGWHEEVAFCISESLLEDRLDLTGWQYCVLLHRLYIAAEKGGLSAETIRLAREALDHTEATKTGKLHDSTVSDWAGYARKALLKIERAARRYHVEARYRVQNSGELEDWRVVETFDERQDADQRYWMQLRKGLPAFNVRILDTETSQSSSPKLQYLDDLAQELKPDDTSDG